MKRFTLLGGAAVGLAILAAGCNSETTPPPATIATASTPPADAKGKAGHALPSPANPNVHRANP